MPMETCKTCKWWCLPDDGAGSHPPKRGQCIHPKLRPNNEAQDGARGGGHYDYGVLTGPDFGCVHHQPLELVSAASGETAVANLEVMPGQQYRINIGGDGS